MVGINERVKCFKDLAVDAFIVHRCSQRKKPLEVLREFLQNKEKRFYIIYRFFMPKTGDIRKLSYNKLLLSTQEFVGRKSLENTMDEVDRLKDRLAKTDQEK